MLITSILSTYRDLAKYSDFIVCPTQIQGNNIVLSDTLQQVGIYRKKTSHSSVFSEYCFSYNSGMKTQQELIPLFGLIDLYKPNTIVLQEFLYDEPVVQKLNTKGYNVVYYPYIFKNDSTCGHLIAYEQEAQRHKLIFDRNTSFPSVRNLFKDTFKIEEIISIVPILETNSQWIGSIHTSSFTSHRNRLLFVRKLVQNIYSNSVTIVGDFNPYGKNINNTTNAKTTPLKRKIQFLPMYLHAMRKFLFSDQCDFYEYEPNKKECDDLYNIISGFNFSLHQHTFFYLQPLSNIKNRILKILLPDLMIRLTLDGLLTNNSRVQDYNKSHTWHDDHDLMVFK